MKLKELAEKCGKSAPFVMNLQKKFDLPMAKAYPEGYAALLHKLMFLSLCSVPQKDIQTLLSRERKLLELLKVDSITKSPFWFEELCTMKDGPSRLLLSGYDLGHMLNRTSVQTGLNFADRESELFGNKEMGEDVLRALCNCMEIRETVLARLRVEIPTLSDALKWGRKVSGYGHPCVKL